MLGWLELNTRLDVSSTYVQRFILPNDVSFRNHHGLRATVGYYLIHPAMDHMISQYAGAEYLIEYHRDNVIGNGVIWKDPFTSMLVLKGDMFGYSRVMESEHYPAIAHKMHEWAESACNKLHYYEVSGGDSILMIDKSYKRLIAAASSLLGMASKYKEIPLTYRFGGAAGPISFQNFKRRARGRNESVTIPIGMALRTSSRIEPYAPKGALIIEECFYNQIEQYVEDLECKLLGKDDIPGLEFDHIVGSFNIRKNVLDPSIKTKLYVISLNVHQDE